MQLGYIGRRLGAFALDCILAFGIVVLGLQNLVFVPLRHLLFGPDTWFRSGWLTEVYTLVTMSLPVWLYFILMELSPWRATVGKRLVRLQTRDAITGLPITWLQALGRTAVKLLPWELSHLTSNLPVPMPYDPNPGFRLGFALVGVLSGVYLAVLLFTRQHRALHDYLFSTQVTNRG